MGRKRLSLKSRRRVRAELKARRGKAKLGDEENRGAKAKQKDRRERTSREGKKRTKRGAEGPGIAAGVASPQLQLKRGVAGLLRGKSECVGGEKKLGCLGTHAAALAKPPLGCVRHPGSPPAQLGAML